MALPQQVVDRLGKEPAETPGWSFGLLLFSGGILAILVITYLGLTLGYEPYLNGQVSSLTSQISTAASAISPSDQNTLVTFYSEIANVQTTLANHVAFSNFLTWLQNNTEANVSYDHLSFSSGNQITLGGTGATEADVNQQIAIFETSPQVQSFSVSGVNYDAEANDWQFDASLTMQPSLLLATQTAQAQAATSTAQTQ